MTEPINIQRELYTTGKAKPPITDNRGQFGERAESMSIEGYWTEGNNDEPICHGGKVIYCHPEAGWPADKECASQYLKIGHIYDVLTIAVGRSSSTIELVAFPSVKFNTVMFSDWVK